ncbi:MAG: FAD-dependent oxidoreductase, partial [Kiritimatiellaeota bacterium]|nr:FAD-dependent oxidoreductase [Kiritimatiellota bacterium]
DAGEVEKFIETHFKGVAQQRRHTDPSHIVSFREKAIAKRGYDVVRADQSEFHRFKDKPRIEFDLNSLPEIGATDVFVVGGGTGGAPAAIGAARAGMKVICAENLPTLGGVMLAGRIGRYWYGNRVGFTREIDAGHSSMAPNPNFDVADGQMNVLWKHEWFLERGVEKGVCFMFDTMCAGAVVRDATACGVVVVCPEGAGVIRAKFVIDATGNADFAAAAGAETACDMREEAAVQGAGLSPKEPDWNYTNTDYTFVLDSDVVDASRAFVMSRGKFGAKWFDVASILNTRERRRIVGDVVLQPQDFFANRTWSDTINRAMSDFDTHGFTIHPMFFIKVKAHDGRFADVPLRALLPRGWEGMAATGLGVSAHRDCMPLIRMQPDVQNQGYAMGKAAALAIKSKRPIREIDFKALQRQLVAEKILDAKTLTDTDVPSAFLEGDEFHDISRAFIDPPAAIPGLKAKLRANPADTDTAMTLAFSGDASGRATLENFISSDWDKGWDYMGMGQAGMSISPHGAAIVALSRIGFSQKGKTLLLRKLSALSITSAFSHLRSVSLALIAHPQKTAAPLLEKILAEPGATGYAVMDYKDALASNRPAHNDDSFRNSQLKEVYLAKALRACDPKSATAAGILSAYENGMQGLYALFATV